MSFQGSNECLCRNAQSAANINQLNNIEPALAAFYFADIRLIGADSLGELYLGEPALLPHFFEARAERLVVASLDFLHLFAYGPLQAIAGAAKKAKIAYSVQQEG